MNNENARTIAHAEDCLYDVLRSLSANDKRRDEVMSVIHALEQLGYSFIGETEE